MLLVTEASPLASVVVGEAVLRVQGGFSLLTLHFNHPQIALKHSIIPPIPLKLYDGIHDFLSADSEPYLPLSLFLSLTLSLSCPNISLPISFSQMCE